MLSSVLRSARAIEVNVAIMRAFVRLRELLGTHKDLAHKLDQLERKLGEHDKKFQVVFEAIRQLMEVLVEELNHCLNADEEAVESAFLDAEVVQGLGGNFLRSGSVSLTSMPP